MIDRAQAAEALGQVLHVEEDLARSGARAFSWRVRHPVRSLVRRARAFLLDLNREPLHPLGKEKLPAPVPFDVARGSSGPACGPAGSVWFVAPVGGTVAFMPADTRLTKRGGNCFSPAHLLKRGVSSPIQPRASDTTHTASLVPVATGAAML
jgi:hypothetical protein